jgi:hypothetical protein
MELNRTTPQEVFAGDSRFENLLSGDDSPMAEIPRLEKTNPPAYFIDPIIYSGG